MAYSPNTALVLGGDREFYEPISPQTLMSGVVQFDMGSQSFANSSAQCCNATGDIERGAMQYVPSFGPEGLFIAMGGLNGLSYNTTNGLIGLSKVPVFDGTKQRVETRQVQEYPFALPASTQQTVLMKCRLVVHQARMQRTC